MSPGSGGGGLRAEDRPTGAARPLGRTAHPESTAGRRTDEPDEALLALAVEHVRRVRERCSAARAVDPEGHAALVAQHLVPLAPDRPWRHRRWQGRRGDAAWVGGQIGLHLPAPRGAAL